MNLEETNVTKSALELKKYNFRFLIKLANQVGGAVAECSKALLERENKRKTKRSQVRLSSQYVFGN